MTAPPTLAAAALAAGIVLTLPGIARAAGPWTTSSPGGVTWAAPHGCTLVLDLATSDGYAGREAISQAHELVVAYRNGVEIGRTVDLADRVAQATAFRSITATVAAGDVVTVRHSSLAGLNDGTPNSVNVSVSFTCPPPASTTTSSTTTTTAPATTVPDTTTPTTTPTSSSAPAPGVVPPSSEATTTTVVATGNPPVPPAPTPSVLVSPPVVSSPRQVTVVALPETGSEARTIAHAAAITLGVGVLLAMRMSRRAVRP